MMVCVASSSLCVLLNSVIVLDMEYRYWSFLESHPAHTGLPPKAHSDAMETLAWALTDRLVHPSQVQVKPPFTHEEVRELNNLLSSFGGETYLLPSNHIAHTCLQTTQTNQASNRSSTHVSSLGFSCVFSIGDKSISGLRSLCLTMSRNLRISTTSHIKSKLGTNHLRSSERCWM